MTHMEASVWDAVSASVAAGALLLSIIVWLTQRRRDRQQADVQARLVAIEAARRGDEVQRREEEKRAALIADVRIVEFRLVQGGKAGDSDKVSITIKNRGPAVATNIGVALLESEDRAPSSGLGGLVESLDEFGGWDPNSRKGYFQIKAETVDALAPSDSVRLPFWLRYRPVGNQRVRLAWADGRGPQVAYPVAEFDPEPAERD
jgi:hypothetical protein